MQAWGEHAFCNEVFCADQNSELTRGHALYTWWARVLRLMPILKCEALMEFFKHTRSYFCAWPFTEIGAYRNLPY